MQNEILPESSSLSITYSGRCYTQQVYYKAHQLVARLQFTKLQLSVESPTCNIWKLYLPLSASAYLSCVELIEQVGAVE